MKGTHSFILETSKIRYELEIKHKFSIFKGESGSGKTALCQKILKRKKDSELATGVRIRTDLKYMVLTDETLVGKYLEQGYNLFFIDEDVVEEICKGNAGATFGQAVKGSSAYFVFMSRNASLSAVPINVDACYKLVEEYRGGKKVVHMENMYVWNDDEPLKPDTFVIEDSKVGYIFYKKTLKEEHECISAQGNTNIINTVRRVAEEGAKYIFVIADGCGYGAYFADLLNLRDSAEKELGAELRLFLPPSFEYLVLKSGIFKYNEDRLANTQDYAKIEDYMGWEAFYTDDLIKASGEMYKKNGKKLPEFFRDRRNVDKVYNTIKEIKR